MCPTEKCVQPDHTKRATSNQSVRVRLRTHTHANFMIMPDTRHECHRRKNRLGNISQWLLFNVNFWEYFYANFCVCFK